MKIDTTTGLSFGAPIRPRSAGRDAAKVSASDARIAHLATATQAVRETIAEAIVEFSLGAMAPSENAKATWLKLTSREYRRILTDDFAVVQVRKEDGALEAPSSAVGRLNLAVANLAIALDRLGTVAGMLGDLARAADREVSTAPAVEKPAKAAKAAKARKAKNKVAEVLSSATTAVALATTV